MDNEAIRPGAEELLPDIDPAEVLEQKGVSDAHEDEKALAQVGQTPGWQKISEQMRQDIEDFRTGRNLEISPNTDLATIGQRYVIASTVATKLQSYLDMVTNALEAVAEYERQQQQSPSE